MSLFISVVVIFVPLLVFCVI